MTNVKVLKNETFKVVFTSETEFTVENKFGDVYRCYFNENGSLCSKSKFGLQYAMKARRELGF